MSDRTPTVKTTPKDFFLHLMVMVALYASTISFTTVVFQIINIWIPDALNDYAYGFESTLRTGLSFLIVFFPVLIFTSWLLQKNYKQDPARARLWIRKWLVYFTLFVSAIIIMVTAVILINRLLDGEVTMRFLLKMLTVFFVTGSVFGYYLNDLKKYKSA